MIKKGDRSADEAAPVLQAVAAVYLQSVVLNVKAWL